MNTCRWLAGAAGLLIVLGAAAVVVPGCRSVGKTHGGADGASQGGVPIESIGTWPAAVTLDGLRGRPDAGGLYCVVAGTVSDNPVVMFRVDPSLGRFESAVVMVREVNRGVVALDGIFVSDVTADELAKLRPRRPFRLLSPGLGVVVVDARGVEITRLRSGQAYQLDLVVQGTRGYAAVSVRFRTRYEVAGWADR